MKYQIEEIKHLLRKQLDGSLTPDEQLFLDSVRPLFDELEWNEWMIDAALALPEPESADPLLRQQTEKLLTDAESRASAGDREPKQSNFPWSVRRNTRWITRGIAACVAVFVLGLLFYIYNPHFVLDEWQRCSEVDPDAELALSPDPVRLSVGAMGERVTLGYTPGDSIQKGHVVVRLLDQGHYGISLQDESDPLDSGTAGSSSPAGSASSVRSSAPAEQFQRIRFETGAYQQIKVSLPDGATVRLDAGSRLDYCMAYPDSVGDLSQRHEWIYLDGQALLTVREHDDRFHAHHDAQSALLVQTIHGWLEGRPGQFVLRVTQDEIRATILSGNMLLNAHTGPGDQVLARSGTQVRLCKLCNKDQKTEDRWSTDKLNPAKIAQSLTWTKAMRHYRKVPLREFVSDMARWYGIEFEDINCISAKATVNVDMCYRASPSELIEFIRNTGTPVIEHKTYYSFCTPDMENRRYNTPQF